MFAAPFAESGGTFRVVQNGGHLAGERVRVHRFDDISGLAVEHLGDDPAHPRADHRRGLPEGLRHHEPEPLARGHVDEAAREAHQRADDLVVVVHVHPEADVGVVPGLRLQLRQHGAALRVVVRGVAQQDEVRGRVVAFPFAQALERGQDGGLILMNVVARDGGQNRPLRVDRVPSE